MIRADWAQDVSFQWNSEIRHYDTLECTSATVRNPSCELTEEWLDHQGLPTGMRAVIECAGLAEYGLAMARLYDDCLDSEDRERQLDTTLVRLFDECLEDSVNFMYIDAGTSGALERGSTGPVDGVMHSFVGRACLRCMDRWNDVKNVADCTGIEIFSPNDSQKHSQQCGCCLIIFQNNPHPHSQKVRDDLRYTLTLAGGARQCQPMTLTLTA